MLLQDDKEKKITKRNNDNANIVRFSSFKMLNYPNSNKTRGIKTNIKK